jgi:type IX secretion system PorP/SprF family membrane protein
MSRMHCMQKIKNIGVFVLAFWGFVATAQDVQFSQFYAAQTYLNPAFAGSVHLPRYTFHQRMQWPRLDAKYITTYASADFFSQKYKSGFGVMVFHDYMGSNTISSSEIHLQYAYELPISKTWTVRSGLQLGLVSRNANYSDLRFPHQFDNRGLQTTDHGYNWDGLNKIYPEVSAGGVVYNKQFWFSFSGSHLNVPNYSSVGGVVRMPVKLSTAIGYKINLSSNTQMAYLNVKEEISLTPVVHYKLQGKSDQLDMGTYFIYQYLMTGVWYRGIPFKKYQSDLQNNEAIVGLVGLMFRSLSVSYSYDFTVSRLKPAAARGAHEINITYVPKPSKRVKTMKRLPCPTFYGY